MWAMLCTFLQGSLRCVDGPVLQDLLVTKYWGFRRADTRCWCMSTPDRYPSFFFSGCECQSEEATPVKTTTFIRAKLEHAATHKWSSESTHTYTHTYSEYAYNILYIQIKQVRLLVLKPEINARPISQKTPCQETKQLGLVTLFWESRYARLVLKHMVRIQVATTVLYMQITVVSDTIKELDKFTEKHISSV
jgi:hypothetical protein